MARAPGKIGLIIQGPLLSVGKDGQRAHIPKVVLGEDGFVTYDCRDNIARIVSEFGHLFDKIVVSTWESEVRPDDHWDGVELLALPDPGEVRRTKFTSRSRNKYRQFFGILGGLKRLDEAYIGYAVRIRTDQYLDLEKLVNSLKMHGMQDDPKRIWVPFTRPADFFVHDIYLAGHTGSLIGFCEAMLSFDQFEFIWCVHREMVLKYAYLQYRAQIGVPDWAYFPHWPPSGAAAETKRIFSHLFRTVFTPLDRDIFTSVQWRGTLLSNKHVVAQYIDSEKASNSLRAKNILDVNAMISVDWGRYHAFLHETQGIATHAYTNAMDRLADRGWKLWNWLRALSRKLRVTRAVYRIAGKISHP